MSRTPHARGSRQGSCARRRWPYDPYLGFAGFSAGRQVLAERCSQLAQVQRLAQQNRRAGIERLGFDISPFPGGATHWRRIVALLDGHGIDCLFDVGANVGQYARAIRSNGYAGRIVSFEPLSAAHAEVSARAAADPNWQVADRVALGAAPGETEINISGESDMSSIRQLDATARTRLASSRTTGRETVAVTTVAAALAAHASPGDRVFVKSDTQGYEDRLLDGIGSAWNRVAGIQLELSLQPIYEDQPDHLPLLERLAEQGLRPHLVIPGYWSRHYGRMLEYDVVCFRDRD